MKNQINKLDDKILISIFLTFFIIIIKIYFLFIQEISDGSSVFLTNTYIYTNLKSFLIHPSSFQDWNHPGTPIYYFAHLLNFIFSGLSFSNITEYLYFQHFFIVILYFYSIYFLINFLSSYLTLRVIFLFLIIFFSFFSFYESLEHIDPHSFQIPIVFFLIVFVLKNLLSYNTNYKNIIVLSFFLSFAISVKLTFLPFFFSSYFAIIYKFFKEKNFILRNLLYFNFSILCFMLILNLPIIGRWPQILFNVFFSRADTSFNIFEINYLIKSLVDYIFRENYLIFIPLLFVFYFFFSYFIKKIIEIFKKKSYLKLFSPIEIFTILLFLCFFYLYLCVGSEIYYGTAHFYRGINFRNADIYFIFLVPLLICSKELRDFLSKKKIIIIFLFVFFFSCIFFLINRNNFSNNISNKNDIFYKKLYSNISKHSKIAVYNNIYGYGFENENLFYRTINIIANDRFSEELFDKFPNVRYLRLNDILHEIKPEILKGQSAPNTASKIKNIRDIWDNFLEKQLSKNFYFFLSHKSLSLSGNYFIGDEERSNSLFIKRKNEKIDYIIFPNLKLFKEYNLSVEDFINILSKKLKIIKVENFKVENDDWYILKIKQ